MSQVMAARRKYRDAFEKKHGVRLGFMSFFVKASIEALRRYPVLNASLDDADIVYHEFFDIGVAGPSELVGESARRHPEVPAKSDPQLLQESRRLRARWSRQCQPHLEPAPCRAVEQFAMIGRGYSNDMRG